MSDWRQLANEERWDEIRWELLSQDEQRELLELLQKYVPMIEVLNGTEVRKRHMETHEAPNSKLKAAALILQLGELEAVVMGAPQEPSSEWNELRQDVERHLNAFLHEPEVTEGVKELSRHDHARQALGNLEAVDRVVLWIVDKADSHEGALDLIEDLSELAQHAFAAGSHAQLAVGKEMEAHAVRGLTTLRAASRGGEVRRAEFAPDTGARIRMMSNLITERGYSVNRAAQSVAGEGLGNPASNRQLWYRHADRTKRTL